MRYPFYILIISLGFVSSGCLRNHYDSVRLSHRYRQATEAHEKGDYALAVVLTENLLDQIPDASRQEELVFIRADSYHQLRDLHDAGRNYTQYLERYPEGGHAEEVRQGLMRLEAEKNSPTPAALESLREAEADREKLLTLEVDYPYDPQIKYLLGNRFYEIGDYERAGGYYYEAQSLEAAFKEKDLIKKRLFINQDGEPEVLTPSAVRHIERDDDPLVVFDIYSYKQRNPGAQDSVPIIANVSGKVRNQGSRSLRRVVVEVQFLNTFGDILDFYTVPIGTLPPGAVRPFLATATNYDNIFNISRVEVRPRVDR